MGHVCVKYEFLFVATCLKFHISFQEGSAATRLVPSSGKLLPMNMALILQVGGVAVFVMRGVVVITVNKQQARKGCAELHV